MNTLDFIIIACCCTGNAISIIFLARASRVHTRQLARLAERQSVHLHLGSMRLKDPTDA